MPSKKVHTHVHATTNGAHELPVGSLYEFPLYYMWQDVVFIVFITSHQSTLLPSNYLLTN